MSTGAPTTGDSGKNEMSVTSRSNNCPVCAAASICQGLCRSELAVFTKVLGKSFAVERDEFLMEGAQRCSYLIRLTGPLSAAGARQ